jgi:HSP20 family protein
MSIRDLSPFRGHRTGHALRSLHEEVDKVFDDFVRAIPSFPSLSDAWNGGSVPSVDVSETDKAFEVAAELPGVEEKDVEVTLVKGVLTIKGEKRAEKEEKGKSFHHVERSYGSFVRSVPLSAEVDADKVQAEFSKGVLKVTLPKKPSAASETKKIAIKAH